ncbi:MAG: hypothetical protein HW403_74 [Dehalococcoidia bacterium]|nr:hypothetical protein [Dehalococcoidia bacterium]
MIQKPSQFSQQAVKVFKALSDRTRYQMVRMLYAKGEVGCAEFQEAFPLSASALSHHYRVLDNAGLIETRKEGLYVYHSLNRDTLESVIPGFGEAHAQ